MHKRLTALLAALIMLICASGVVADAPVADDTVNYEISSYAVFLTVRPNGDVRVREEFIYNNPSAYEGFSHAIDLTGAEGYEDIEVWEDGQALSTESTERNSAYYTAARADNNLEIFISAPGDSDWRTFVFAYTLKGLAQRSEDTGLLRRTLIPADREARYQNAAAIITLPQSDGEILVWTEPALSDDARIIRYDTVSLGPIDMPADQSFSVEVLFPAAWLPDASLSTQPVDRNAVIARHEAATEIVEQQKSTFRAQQYIACGVYIALCLLSLWWLKRKYGFKSAKIPDVSSDMAKDFPVALSAFVRHGEANAAALSGTLCELDKRRVITLTREGEPRFDIVDEKASVCAHQRAALDILKVYDGTNRLSGFNAGNDSARARAFEHAYRQYRLAVSADAAQEGLIWQNERLLIAVNAACILLGFMLMGVLLLVGKTLLVEAVVIFALMMIMLKLYDRVRRLTDKGEALLASSRAAASSLAPDKDQLPLMVALGMADDGIDELKTWQRVTDAIQKAHLHNASMRGLHHNRH